MDKTTLRRLTGELKKRRFAVIDIEARKWVNPYAVGFLDGKTYVDFITDDDSCIGDALVHILTPAYAGYWIYAHNGGNYDFLFLVKALLHNKKLRSKYFVELTPIGSCVVRMDVTERAANLHELGCSIPGCKGCAPKTDKSTGSKLKWTFVDSARLMPLPLKEIGEIFGITKKVELQMSYDDLAKYENRDIMRHYLRTDCGSLLEALELMQNRINGLGGQIGITLPATSLDLFRRKFLKDDIATNRHWKACPQFGQEEPKGKDSESCKGCLHEFIRQGYFGGRTEIYRMKFAPYDATVGDEWAERIDHIDHALMYDFNSHYPNCMLAAMPTGEAIELPVWQIRDEGTPSEDRRRPRLPPRLEVHRPRRRRLVRRSLRLPVVHRSAAFGSHHRVGPCRVVAEADERSGQGWTHLLCGHRLGRLLGGDARNFRGPGGPEAGGGDPAGGVCVAEAVLDRDRRGEQEKEAGTTPQDKGEGHGAGHPVGRCRRR
jgi:hypothetical protein